MVLQLNGLFVNGREGLNPSDFITPDEPEIQSVAAGIIQKVSGQDNQLARLREAYNYVSSHVKYITDKQHHGYLEVWAMPTETLKRGLGDCEDLSFLLTSLLLALGVSARVEFGTWNGEGHAWVYVNVPGAQGILESTTGQPFSGFADPTAYSVDNWVGASSEDPLAAFIMYVAPGFILFGVGAFLMIDDAPDAFKLELSEYGQDSYGPGRHGILKGVSMPGLPPHPHHWLIGFILVVISIIVLGLGILLWMLKFL